MVRRDVNYLNCCQYHNLFDLEHFIIFWKHHHNHTVVKWKDLIKKTPEVKCECSFSNCCIGADCCDQCRGQNHFPWSILSQNHSLETEGESGLRWGQTVKYSIWQGYLNWLILHKELWESVAQLTWCGSKHAWNVKQSGHVHAVIQKNWPVSEK